jgi:hypothetical protein
MIKIKNINSVLAAVKVNIKETRDNTAILVTNSIKDKLASATPVDTGNARAGWKVVDGNIVNEVEYIADLNNGLSPQAEARFIEAVIISDNRVKVNGIIVTDN